MIQINRQEFRPSPLLSHAIDRIWVCESEGSSTELSDLQTCLPLGMMEWIIQLEGNPIIGWYNDKLIHYPGNYFIGLMKNYAHWRMYGRSKIIGVRIKPEAAIQLFGQPISEFTEKSIDAENVLRKDELNITDQLVECKSTAEQIKKLEMFLHKRLKKAQDNHSYFASVFSRLRMMNSNFSTEVLADSFYLSERQTQRLFKENIGLSPKTYEKIIRFSKAVNDLKMMANPNWAQMAVKLGYSDQAHMIREFKTYAGTTPAGLIK